MTTKLGLVLLAAGCATSPTDHKLPSASLTPRAATDSSVACGDSIAWYGDTSPDLTYTFTYNAANEVTHAEGVFTAGGSDDAIDYTWDASGDFTGMTEGNGSYTYTIGATYDATNGMTDYATAYTSTDYNDGWDYAMTSFVAPWEPGREVITETGGTPFGYTLAYDSDGRLTSATPDSGDAISYAYDDVARTITIDSGMGAFHGVITYDADFDELSETWSGTDPSAIASETDYTWSSDELQTASYSSGSTTAPTTLSLIETDTMQYTCSMAARAHGPGKRPMTARPMMGR